MSDKNENFEPSTEQIQVARDDAIELLEKFENGREPKKLMTNIRWRMSIKTTFF